ncbi:MAG TPA: hypothetical protein PKN80_01945 [bacterium]|nr:hypothetical protein [bacterium]HNS48022.1 hypothetical protein [bacterium]
MRREKWMVVFLVGAVSFVLMGPHITIAATQNELLQLVKMRSEILKEGKVSLRVFRYYWKNENDYKTFTEKLKVFNTTPPNQFLKWLSEEKGISLSKAMLVGNENQTYFFKGNSDHLISDWNFDEIDYVFVEKKGEYLFRPTIPERIIKITHSEYSTNGSTICAYRTVNSKGIMNIGSRISYFKVSNVDLALLYYKQLPEANISLNFIAENNKCIYQSTEVNDMKLQLIFDVSLAGVIPYLKIAEKNGKILRETISGAFSKVNDNIHLPFFTSTTIPTTNVFLKDVVLEQTLYIIDNWELRPVTSEELLIHPLKNTTVSDQTFGEPTLNYPYIP